MRLPAPDLPDPGPASGPDIPALGGDICVTAVIPSVSVSVQCAIFPHASRPRPSSPSRSRRLPPRPASHRPHHRHRAHARGLRDDRAGARPAPRHAARARARRGDPRDWPRRARGSASWPAPAPARRSASGRSPSRSCGVPLTVGVVNREREATPGDAGWNVVIVTTGIARRWFQDDLITGRDTIIVDEIHQTSAELELCLALGKRAGCRFIWLSATVDPAFYARYLDSAIGAGDQRLRSRAQGEGAGPAADARRVPQRAVHPPRDQGEARRGGVRAHPRRGRAAGRRSWASSGSASRRRSTTAASRSASSARSSRARSSARSCWR